MIKISQLITGDSSTYTKDSVLPFIIRVVQLMIEIAGAIAIIFLILGAFQYLTAYGNEEKAAKGKSAIIWAIIGIVVIILSEVIVRFVWSYLSDTPFPTLGI